MPRDLAGLLVVSLEQAVAAPYASSRLADAGARVVKLERAEGDFARGYDRHVLGSSAYFVWLNRGKESALFDLKAPDDIAFLHRMLASADVFIQNLVPGATTRAGIGSAALRKRYPRLITCDISGYGSAGPYRDMKAYDLLIQAESGLSFITGNESGPGRVGVSVCDIACGMYSVQAILQALFARERSGAGRGIEVSLFDSIADWMNVPYLQYRYGGHTPGRMGLKHPTIAPYGLFLCGDNEGILIAIQNEREWARFCNDILGNAALTADPRFSSNPARVANRGELEAEIGRVFAEKSRDAVAAGLTQAQIAFGRLSTLADLARHPQARFVEVGTAAGPVTLLAPAPVVDGAAQDCGPVPALGEHDATLRREFAAQG